MAAGPFTPTIRAYTEATSLLTTDAFILDRLGVGTMFIQGLALENTIVTIVEAAIGSPTAFRVEIADETAMTNFNRPIPPFSTVKFDTDSGFSIRTLPSPYDTLGPIPVYQIPSDGYYCFHLQMYFKTAQLSAQNISTFLSLTWLGSDASDKDVFGSQTGHFVMYPTGGTDGSNQFSVDVTCTLQGVAGDFLFPAVTDNTAAAWHTTTYDDFNCAFEGFKIR